MTDDGPLDWSFNWSSWLAGDTISGSLWEITSDKEAVPTLTIGPTPPSIDGTNTKTFVWVQGGTPNVIYKLINTVTTAAGRKQSRSILVRVKNTILID